MAIVRVQGNARGTSLTDTISVTMASNPISGNVLVAVIGVCASAARTVLSIVQAGVTWTYQIGIVGVYDYDDTAEIWFGVVGAGASKDVTVTLSWVANHGGVADICEYSGVETSGFLDKTATSSGWNDLKTGTTVATTQANELWIGGIEADYSRTQSLPTNGFTLLDGALYDEGSLAYLEKIVSATGTANSGTTASGNCASGGCIATFKGKAAAPPKGTIGIHAKLAGII